MLFCFLFILLTSPRDLWEDGKEDAALTGGATHADTATLGLDEVPGESQTQTCSLILFGGISVELLELNKESPDILRRDAEAGILYLQDERLPSSWGRILTVTRPSSGVNLMALERKL